MRYKVTRMVTNYRVESVEIEAPDEEAVLDAAQSDYVEVYRKLAWQGEGEDSEIDWTVEPTSGDAAPRGEPSTKGESDDGTLLKRFAERLQRKMDAHQGLQRLSQPALRVELERLKEESLDELARESVSTKGGRT
jgi:hypothetical protein